MRLASPSPEHTRRAARALAGAVGPEGLLVALCGPLGAGKTEFVKGLAEGFGLAAADVTSPTFVIAVEHALTVPGGPHGLVHVDLYRLGDVHELEATGFADWLAPGQLVAVEWADRWPEALPDTRLEVRLGRDASEAGGRRIEAVAFGTAAVRVLERWERAAAGTPPGETRETTQC